MKILKPCVKTLKSKTCLKNINKILYFMYINIMYININMYINNNSFISGDIHKKIKHILKFLVSPKVKFSSLTTLYFTIIIIFRYNIKKKTYLIC